MKNEIIKSAIKSAIDIADLLDREGREELASRMDAEIIEALQKTSWQNTVRKIIDQQEPEEVEVEIPEEERQILEDVLLSLQNSLKSSSKI